MVCIFLTVFAALFLPAVLVAQSSGTEVFAQVGVGTTADVPAIGAAAGIRIPLVKGLQITGNILTWSASGGACPQSFPESLACEVSGHGAEIGFRGQLPEIGMARPFIELGGGGFRSDLAGEGNIDPHAAFKAGVAFDITEMIRGSLALHHLRVFGSRYEELLDQSLNFTGGVLGISIPITR